MARRKKQEWKGYIGWRRTLPKTESVVDEHGEHLELVVFKTREEARKRHRRVMTVRVTVEPDIL